MKQKFFFECLYDIYSGILANNQEFNGASVTEIEYNFYKPEFSTLKEKYKIDEIAGAGSEFQKAKRLCAYFAPRLTHKSNFTVDIPCNSLALLEYGLDNKNQGINCLKKAKILTECLLALGIYARRVGIYPYSPFDQDNHIVTEVFDNKLSKWIMIDPTNDCYYIDKNKNPLSVFEYRDKVSKGEFATIITTRQSNKNPKRIFERNLSTNIYFAKNAFYYTIDAVNTFGGDETQLYFYPQNFDLKKRFIHYFEYLVENGEKLGFSASDTKRQKVSIGQIEAATFTNSDISIMLKPPN